VGAITLAQRDNASSGSTLDIKSRESAAYAGLVYALGELQRDPANLVTILEAWRKGTITGSPLYLQFSATGADVVLTATDPGNFTPPGSSASIKVQLTGVFVPANASTAPILSLSSTGIGRSGDAQTVIGAYQIQNLVFNTPSANLGITHAFYLNGTGNFNNLLNANNGDVYLGGNVQVNGATQLINVTNGGLHVNGNFFYNAGVTLSVDNSSYVTGNFQVQGGGITFKNHLVIQGGLSFTAAGPMTVKGALVVQGAAGISDLNQGTLNVGSAVPNSELYIPAGQLFTSNAGGNLNVTGPAYIHQLALTNPNGSGTQLSVSGRLEWSDNSSLTQTFIGMSTSGWGQLVARTSKSGSAVTKKGTLNIGGNSWSEFPTNLALGASGNQIAFNKLYHQSGLTPANWYVTGTVSTGAAPGVNRAADGLTSEGFDAANPPYSLATLGDTIPASETEVGFDPTLDPTIGTSAWVATGSTLCQDAATQCGAGLNAAYNTDVAAGSHHFYHGFFVVQLNSGMKFTWDLSGTQTTPLQGKYLFLVQGNIGGTDIWPTTATNANPAAPTNIEFIYVAPTGSIFANFAPRYQNNNNPVTFCGYVRVNNPNTSSTWNPLTPVVIDGAFHITGANDNLTINSGGANTPTFTLDQNVLNVIGAAFGSVFTNPVTNQPLANPALSGFALTENWIQFRPLGELR
jgi:hypothetical protein